MKIKESRIDDKCTECGEPSMIDIIVGDTPGEGLTRLCQKCLDSMRELLKLKR